jgi:hypothetical protein
MIYVVQYNHRMQMSGRKGMISLYLFEKGCSQPMAEKLVEGPTCGMRSSLLSQCGILYKVVNR